MNIDAKHSYRFKYLRSEHWQNLRLEKLASVDARCFYCWKRDLSNDVHHLDYKRLYDVKIEDLLVVCRDCHKIYHKAFDDFGHILNTAKNPQAKALATIKLLRVAEGKTPSIKDHFNEIWRLRFRGEELPERDEKLTHQFHFRITEDTYQKFFALPRSRRREITEEVRRMLRVLIWWAEESSRKGIPFYSSDSSPA